MATKAFDLSKFRKTLTKSIDGLSVGFQDPTDWVSTGNYALNYLISSDFHRGIPLGKVTVFAGESGAGKSYICSGNIVRAAQEQGIYVVLIDSENALDEKWLHALGVDTAEDKLLKLNMAMIDDVAKTINEFMKVYKAMEDRPKVLFVIDSLGMLLTPTDVNQFEAGDLKGDMGRKPKALTALVRNCVNMFGAANVGLVATNHTYASQDMFDPDDKISGGQGFIYASSIVVAMRKLKLKEDEDGNKISEVKGIRAACKIMKTRYAKPFESVQVKIPYETGMNPYSGLVDLFEAKGFLQKDGNRLKYAGSEELKLYRKEWERNEDGCLDKVMIDFANNPNVKSNIDLETGEIVEHE
jgi:RecA/RadA recombinase